MRQGFTANAHWYDREGRPEGGHTSGVGFAIAWQRGPLGTGAERSAPNGAFVEDIIAAAISRLEFYQASEFACLENAAALNGLHEAMEALNRRTVRRVARGVEGTHTA